MKLLFWLYKAKKNKKGLMPLMMRITLDGQRVNFPTQITVEESTWLHDRQEMKDNSELTHKYNQYLLNMKTKAWEVYNEAQKKDEPLTPQKIRDYILGNDASTHTLIEALDYHIGSLKARIGYDVAPATVRNYEACKRKIEAFLQEERNPNDIFLSEMSYQVIQELDVFMRVKNGLKNNGVIKHMQQLRRVIRVAMLNEWMSKDPFAKYAAKIEEPKRVHLTREELQKLEEMPLPSERLGRVRDVFVFACYTGLAYADMRKLVPDHLQYINGMNWVILDRTKTKNQSTIPLLPKASEILKRYEGREGGRLLPLISSQNLNRYLKEVAAAAGIRKRLTFHAARHTFASTVTLNEGVDITTVSAMLGHKMLKTTQIYARVNLNKIALDVEKLMGEGGV
jgi:site-specific recombinase XerD